MGEDIKNIKKSNRLTLVLVVLYAFVKPGDFVLGMFLTTRILLR